MARNILVVEDDRNISDLIRMYLEKEGFEVRSAYDGGKAVEEFDKQAPDMVLLDIMLPVMDGWAVCAYIREKAKTPIIMLTAKSEVNDRITGLEMGADDYLVKPFEMKELMARVKANIRRRSMEYTPATPAQAANTVEAGGLALNQETYQVTKNGVPVDLTQKEYDLLSYLIRERGKVFSREDLMQRVWNYEYYGDMRTVDVTVRRLREKIEDDPGKPRYILTRRGVGYYFAG